MSKETFDTFEDCLEYWEERYEADTTTNISAIFDVPDDETEFDMLSNLVEILFDIEDEFDCSGICKPALFFHAKDIAHGPPLQSCITPMVEYITSSLGLFMDSS